MKIVFFSGVGAVGKTSVIKEFSKHNPSDYVVMPSITRSVYAKLGIENEATALDSSLEIKLLLQQTIFFTYVDEVRKLAADSSAINKILLIDRSPLDHWSYFSSKFSPSLLINNEYSLAYKKLCYLREYATIALLEELNFRYKDILLVKFPFPNHWNNFSETSSDGFRADSYRSNSIWNTELDNCLLKCRNKLSFDLKVLMLEVNASTSTDRHKEILSNLERNS